MHCLLGSRIRKGCSPWLPIRRGGRVAPEAYAALGIRTQRDDIGEVGGRRPWAFLHRASEVGWPATRLSYVLALGGRRVGLAAVAVEALRSIGVMVWGDDS